MILLNFYNFGVLKLFLKVSGCYTPYKCGNSTILRFLVVPNALILLGIILDYRGYVFINKISN
jgi:hypothetical protein